MKALGIAAAAAIALAPFSVVATTPGVAQAAPFAGVGADISTGPTLPEPAPSTVTPVQTPQVVPPSPPPPSAIAVVAADEEPTRPWWHSALHYGVLVIVVGLVAWTVGLSLRRANGTPQIPPRPQPDQKKKEVDRQSIRMFKRNLEILNSRYSDFERRVFDQIAETDQRSFIVEAGFEVLLLHAVRDGLLKRVELSPVAIQRGEPTHHKYEVTDAGLNLVSRYIRGEHGVGEHQSAVSFAEV
jgi:hypothetical protein